MPANAAWLPSTGPLASRSRECRRAASGLSSIPPTRRQEKVGRCWPRNLISSAGCSAVRDVEKADGPRNVQGCVVDTHGRRASDVPRKPSCPCAPKFTSGRNIKPGNDELTHKDSRQSAVGEITYISGSLKVFGSLRSVRSRPRILYHFWFQIDIRYRNFNENSLTLGRFAPVTAANPRHGRNIPWGMLNICIVDMGPQGTYGFQFQI